MSLVNWYLFNAPLSPKERKLIRDLDKKAERWLPMVEVLTLIVAGIAFVVGLACAVYVTVNCAKLGVPLW